MQKPIKFEYTKSFVKQFSKLSPNLRQQFKNRQVLWLENPSSPILHTHPLKGRYLGYYSINITGDVRALYKLQGQSIVVFGFIGSHSQLYG